MTDAQDSTNEGLARLANRINGLRGRSASVAPGVDFHRLGGSQDAETVFFEPEERNSPHWLNSLEDVVIAAEGVENVSVHAHWKQGLFFEVVCLTDEAATEVAANIDPTK